MTDNDIRDDEGHTEATDPMLLPPATALELLAGTPWRRFAVIGDSTAAGTGDPWPGYDEVPWADRLAATMTATHPDFAYLNTGKIGATIGQVRAEQARSALDFEPDLVHISCGGNDLFLFDADPRSVERDLEELCTTIATSGAQLSMFTLADAFTGRLRALRPRFIAFAEVVRRVAARHDAILTDLWDHPARFRQNWLSQDHIHLTMAGHAVVASEVIRSLAQSHRGTANGAPLPSIDHAHQSRSSSAGEPIRRL